RGHLAFDLRAQQRRRNAAGVIAPGVVGLHVAQIVLAHRVVPHDVVLATAARDALLRAGHRVTDRLLAGWRAQGVAVEHLLARALREILLLGQTAPGD